jgi:hypothetical protein
LTTTDKDFKVKNGLVVNDGGTFGGPVVVGTPTESSHAVTKEYLDAAISALPGSNLDGGDVTGATYTDGGTPATESWDATIDAGNI